MKRALIVVDIQNDFLPGGALAVPGGDQIIPLVNALMPRYEHVVATQDWHPADHGSFAANHAGRTPGEVIELAGLQQVLWPTHCVQETSGAAFADALDRTRIHHVVRKGTDPAVDSYSGFYDNGHRRATGLAEHLAAEGVTDVDVVGIAADYCVKFTALDALREGLSVRLITGATRGVNLRPGDTDRAFAELHARGCVLLTRAERASV
ncbi:MAG: bifunctional nicotinamidase/pyrazinamidase [Catalinimonas sp.]